jgi:hypothetical protein
VVQLVLDGTQAGLDVAEAFAIGELSEAETEELVPAGESAITGIAAITCDAFLKFLIWNMQHQLRENRSAKVHTPLSSGALGWRRPMTWAK